MITIFILVLAKLQAKAIPTGLAPMTATSKISFKDTPGVSQGYSCNLSSQNLWIPTFSQRQSVKVEQL